MKHTLTTLPLFAALTALGGAAAAETGVTLYGVIDTGIIKESGASAIMGSNKDNRIGIRGREALGAGLEATFELEHRFSLHDGANDDEYNYSDRHHEDGTLDWQGPANVGLASSGWGAVRIGRNRALSIETFRRLDPFDQHGIGSTLTQTPLYAEFLPNTLRYDSPVWRGWHAKASYSLGNDRHTAGIAPGDRHDGYALALTYDNGPVMLLASYDRRADAGRSWFWNAGGAYTWQSLTVSLGYQRALIRIHEDDTAARSDLAQQTWLAGLRYQTGAHTVNASFNLGEVDTRGSANRVRQYALGYTYALSRRTSLYANLVYADYDHAWLADYYAHDISDRPASGEGRSALSVTGTQIGITHRF